MGRSTKEQWRLSTLLVASKITFIDIVFLKGYQGLEQTRTPNFRIQTLNVKVEQINSHCRSRKFETMSLYLQRFFANVFDRGMERRHDIKVGQVKFSQKDGGLA